MITGEQFIGNKRSAKGNKIFTGNNAELKFYEATAKDINEACELAHRAFLLYRNFPDRIKANFLEAIASGIEANRTMLLQRTVKTI